MYWALFILLILPSLVKADVVVIGGPPTINTTDTSFTSSIGDNWHIGIDKVGTRKVIRAENANTGRYFQMAPGAPSAWLNASKQDQRVTVEYLWPGVDLTYLDINRRGFEITHVISDSNKLNNNTIRWFVQTNVPNRSVSSDTLFYANKKAHIAPAIAWDAEGDTLIVTRAISYVNNSVQTFGDSVFRITDNITGTGIVMPVWYDPSVALTVTTDWTAGTIYSAASWPTAHGTSSSRSQANMFIGDAEHPSIANLYTVHRAALYVPTATFASEDSVVTDSIIVTLKGGSQTINNHFNWGPCAGIGDSIKTQNFTSVTGFTSAGSAYSGIVKYAQWINSASFATTQSFKLNSVAVDSFNAAINDGRRFAIYFITSKDSAATVPTTNVDDNRIVYKGDDGGGNEPIVTQYYHLIPASTGNILTRSRGTILYEKFPPSGRITGKVLSQPYRRNP